MPYKDRSKKNEAHRRWRRKHPEKLRQSKKRYRQSHREQYNAWQREDRRKNPERYRTYDRKNYLKEHPNATKVSLRLPLNFYRVRKAEYKAQWVQIITNFGMNKCSKCGYDKCFEAIDFHHPTGRMSGKDGKKQLGGTILNGKPTPERIERLKKTVPLCANCHRELHVQEKSMGVHNKKESDDLENCQLSISFRAEDKNFFKKIKKRGTGRTYIWERISCPGAEFKRTGWFLNGVTHEKAQSKALRQI